MNDQPSQPSLSPQTSRRTHLIFLAAFVMEFAGGVAVVALPLLAISLGASAFELGCLGSCRRLPYIGLCFLFGSLSDRIGRKTLATSACVGLIAIYATFPWTSTLSQLYALSVAFALAISLFWPPVQAWVSEIRTASLGPRTSFFNMAWSVGSTFGFLVGGALAERSLRLPFFVCCGLAMLLLGLILSTPAKRRRRKSEPPEPVEPPELPEHPLTDTFLFSSWVANFTAFLSVGALLDIFPKLAKSLGMGGTIIGTLLFGMGISRTLTFFALGRSERWWYRLRWHLAAEAIGIVGIVIVATGEQWLTMLVGFMLVGHMCGRCYGASLFYCLRSVGRVGKRAGLHEGILVAGAMTGSFLGGWSAEHIDPRSPYWIAAGLIVVGGLVQSAMVWLGRRRVARASSE